MRSNRWCTNGLALVASVCVGIGVNGCVVGDDPDDEGPIVTDEESPIAHPDLDTAGSQIMAVEGTDFTDGSISESALAVSQTPGNDVSSFQGNVNWNTAKANGDRFAYIKATEGVGYQNPYFSSQYLGSYHAGIIRGAYHFALPDRSTGSAQADYFVDHGGGWSKDGKTFPPAIDLEWNPYGGSCYGKTQAQMVSWIHAFANRIKARTGRDAVFYTSTSWWTLCTGNNGGFGVNPLWIARYASSVGTLPRGWSFYTIWQNADHGIFPGDHDLFNGAYSRVQAFAL